MSHSIGIDELERIIAEMEPAEVEARYGGRLEPEAKAYFDAYCATCKDLDNLNGMLEALAPPVPQVRPKARLIPFHRRVVSLPIWSLPLTAAALLCLGLLLPQKDSPVPLEPQVQGAQEDSPVPYEPLVQRAPAETPKQNARISDAFFERGKAFMSKGNHDAAWEDFSAAFSYLPDRSSIQRKSILEEMQIVAEQMKDQGKQTWVKDLLSPKE